MIRLHGFGPQFGLMDPSPFVLKVDIYLRMAEIPYQVRSKISNLTKAPKAKLPFITDGDKVIADSSFIIEHLKQQYGDILDIALTPHQQAIAYLVSKSLDENFYWCLVYSRWINESTWLDMKASTFSFLSFPLKHIVPVVARRRVVNALNQQGIGRHSEAEIKHIFINSLNSLADLLGEQTYFLGEQPTSLDATAFAMLAEFILADLQSEFNDIAKTYPSLVSYCERIYQAYY